MLPAFLQQCYSIRYYIFLTLIGFTYSHQARAQTSATDQQAAMLLAAGQKAFNDANPAFAADRFREFIQKYGGHKDVNQARYGLGLALLDIQPLDLQKVVDALGPPASDATFPQRAEARYYLASAHRNAGLNDLLMGLSKPNEIQQFQQAASGKFANAAREFGQARELFEKKTPPDIDHASRARCDQADMELRLNRAKEARSLVEVFLKDASLAKSPSHKLGLYYFGISCFMLDDLDSSGKSLGLLTPFDESFGVHALYILGRIHLAQGEKAEAAQTFEKVLVQYVKQKNDAVETLKQPGKFKNQPWEKARLELLIKSPPDYAAGSAFYSACLLYESGRFTDALAKFQTFGKEFALSPLKDDALLRSAFCFVQIKQFEEAIKTLQPLTNVQRIADQAFYWIGKAKSGLALNADPNNPNLRTQLYNDAIGAFRTAADRAAQLGGNDPDVRIRRAEIQLEMASTQLANNQPRDAASVYEAIWNEKNLPNRSEEILQRMIVALQLARDFVASENRINEFKQKYPQSTLLPLVLFRSAENTFARTSQSLKENPRHDAKPGFLEAVKKYEDVIARFPEFDRLSRVRYGLALSYLALGDYEKVTAVLESIPPPDRNGELAGVPFLLADCLIRTAPTKAEDALQDNMLREKISAASSLLEAFVNANPKGPEAAEAIVKFGYCQKKLGMQLPAGNERNDALNRARSAFERVQKEYGQSIFLGTAVLERIKIMILQGDKGGAINTLRQFYNDPLQKTSVAPLAFISLATLLREQNDAKGAVQVIQEARGRYERMLRDEKDPERRSWFLLLKYHHAVALFESGNLNEARREFDGVVYEARDTPIAIEAALRASQSSFEGWKKNIDSIEKEIAKGGLKPEQLTQLDNQLKAAKAELGNIAKQSLQRASELKQQHPTSEARARMYYDAAWAFKAAGQDSLPTYIKLIEEFPTLSLTVEVRLELAELLKDSGKIDESIAQLKAALEAEPIDRPIPLETNERIRLRLGTILFEKKDIANAQTQFDAVASNEKSPLRGAALYYSAECLISKGNWEEAKNKLTIFRDNGAFHQVANISDRAMLRLGHVLAHLKQWDASRQAFESLLGRYGDGNTWAVDARYGIGWALQNQGRFDEAVNQYAQVTQKTEDDRSGRASLQIGLCRAAQKRWSDAGKAFETVYYGFDQPDLKFAAMIEHARTLGEEKKNSDAERLLERVVKEATGGSTWSKAAQEMLAKIKK